MSSSETDISRDDPRLNEILARYLQAAESSQPIDGEQLILAHPEYADELREFFTDKRQLDELAGKDSPAAIHAPTLTPEYVIRLKAPRRETVAPRPGTIVRYFGDYELLEEIARGGMGVVYKARQVKLNRIVALKMILSGQLASKEDVQRFYTEAEAAARLDHRGIVPIIEVGDYDGQHFFSMGYVDGESLASRLASGPLPPREAAELVRDVAESIQYAHERGVIHRDLKPANVLLQKDEGAVDSSFVPHSSSFHPRVTDFGLAKKLECDSKLTGTGQILGTPSYMPPEQAAGRTSEVPEAADVYSLGAILFATLTGRPPFQADNPLDTLLQVLEREPVSPRTLNPKVPLDLETICLKSLEKDPRRRYGSARRLGEELQRFLNGEPIQARPISRLARSWRWCKRNPLVASLSAAVMLSLFAGAIISTLFAVQARLRADGESEQRKRADAHAKEARAQRDNAQDQLWKSLISQARAERLAGRCWESWQAVRKAAVMKRTANLRQEAIQTISEPGVHLLHSIPFGSVSNLSFNADGTMLGAMGSYALPPRTGPDDDSRIVCWEMPSGRRTATTTVGLYPLGAFDSFFCPNSSNVILQTGKDETALWNPKTGATLTRFAMLPGGGVWLGNRYLIHGKFSPDGKRIAINTSLGLRVWNIPSGTEAAQHPAAFPVTFLSNDVLLVWDQKTLFRWNTSSGLESPVLPYIKNVLDVTPEGRAAVIDDDSIRIWDLNLDKEIAALPVPGGQIQFARLSSDGRLLGFQLQSASDTIHIWDSAAGDFKRPITGIFGSQGDYKFNRDGTLLAGQAGNRVVKIWSVETGETLRALRGNEAPVWSSNGDFLATVGAGLFDLPDGGSQGGSSALVNVWGVANPTPNYIELPLRPIELLTFTPNGKQLATDRAVWDIVRASARPLLHGTSVKGVSSISAVCASGEVWSFQSGARKGTETGIPEHLVTLKRLVPQARTVEVSVPGQVGTHSISSDGKLVAVASEIQEFDTPGATGGSYRFRGHALELRDLSTNTKLWTKVEPQGTDRFIRIAFSHDAKWIATARQNAGVEIWDAATGNKLHKYGIKSGSGATVPQCVVFSPDSNLVVFGDGDGEVVIGNVQKGTMLTHAEGHRGNVFCLAVHPTDHFLASGGEDGMIRLWELPSGRQLAGWEAHDDSVTAIAFSPDGNTLASGGADSTVKLWNLSQMHNELETIDLDW